MEKTIFFIFIFLIFVPITYALNVGSITCYDSGKIKIVGVCGEAIHTDMINIYARYESKNITFEVTGSWSNSIVPTCERSISFDSNEGIFNRTGIYNIELKYPKNEKLELKTNFCPGVQFSCSMIDLDIEKCYTTNGYLRIILNADGLKQPKFNIDLYSDVTYDIVGNKLGWLGSLPNSTIRNIETDKYLIMLFVGQDNKIESTSIKIKTNICSTKDFPSTTSFKMCEKEGASCENNSQCLDDEFCEQESKKCQILECEKGYPGNHRCIECTSDSYCNDRLVCTDDFCIDNKCVHNRTICESADICMIGTCEEPVGCKYSIDEKCIQTRVFKGQSLENVQFIQILSDEEIQKELDNNPKLKKEIEDATGSNITPSYIKNVALLMPEISRRTQFQRGIIIEENKTKIILKAKYLGDGKVEKLVIYDDLPKAFAENASEISVKALGSLVKVVKEDPSFAILYPKIDPLQEWTIEYSVNKSLDPSILNQTSSPMVLAENIEGYNPNSVLYFYAGIVLLIVIASTLGIYSIKKPKEIIIKKTVGGIFKESDKALILNKVSLKHKSSILLDDVSFAVKKETMCSIIGLSGSGKSMVIETIAGRKTPNEGYIEVFGKNTKTERQEINKMTGFVPQHPELYMNETLWQNMMNSATKWNIKDGNKKSENILKHLGLTERKNLMAKNLSGGQLKLLSLGTELLREPGVLLLDEPTTGLDPSTRSKIMTILTHLVNEEGKTVIFSSHFMDEIEDCDQIIIINKGRLVVSDSPDALKRRMPGEGKILGITLNKVSGDILEKIEKIDSVACVIRDGKNLRIITSKPDIIYFSKKITDIGGSIDGIKSIEANMKDVFIYYTGEEPHE